MLSIIRNFFFRSCFIPFTYLIINSNPSRRTRNKNFNIYNFFYRVFNIIKSTLYDQINNIINIFNVKKSFMQTQTSAKEF